MKYHLISGHRCGSNYVAEVLNYNNQAAKYKDPFWLEIPWYCEDVQAYSDVLEKYNAAAITLKIMPYSFFGWSRVLADMIVKKLEPYEVVILQRDHWDRFVSLVYKNEITKISKGDIHDFDNRLYMEQEYLVYFRERLRYIDLDYKDINRMDQIVPGIEMIQTKEKPTGNDYRSLITNYDEAKVWFDEIMSV